MFIHQPRRKRKGWDGCRDRADKRLDLAAKLQWRRPQQRQNAKAVFSTRYESLILYGGLAYDSPQQMLLNRTAPYSTLGDIWQCVTWH